MKIAIVNDVVMDVEALRRVLAASPEHQIAWIAHDGIEAVELCAQDTPDLILMDLMMPGMDGVEATRRIMSQTPCAILIVTATVERYNAKVFEALGAGALDVMKTPVMGPDGDSGGADALLSKIRLLERLVMGSKKTAVSPPSSSNLRRQPVVLIGASAGGPAALAAILQQLPHDFPAAIVIVQHVDAQFASSMASWLNDQSALHVRIAHEGDQPRAGTVLMAGSEDHLIFINSHTLGYTPDPLDCSYHPSINVLFESALQHKKSPVIGVLLTGMGRDGAKGLKLLRDAGAMTIAQDRDTCVVYGMPKAAADIGAAAEILPLAQIAPRLLKLCSQMPKLLQ